MNRIAVLITCHNRKDKTLTCLEHLNVAIGHVTGYLFDIYLVDDGSIDGTAGAVLVGYPKVNIIIGDGNLFWNRGMHTAWKLASDKYNYDYYLWLNDDTFLLSEALNLLLAATILTKERSIIVGPTCSNQDDKLTYSGFSKANILIEPNHELQECTYFQGNCVLIPKIIFQYVGNLDKVFHHAIGDFDYGLRAQKAGYKNYVVGEYIGFCEDHDELPMWCLKNTPLFQRIKSLYSPLGNSHPCYFFRFEFRHFGIYIALKHFFSLHVRVLFPQLWKKKIQLFSK